MGRPTTTRRWLVLLGSLAICGPTPGRMASGDPGAGDGPAAAVASEGRLEAIMGDLARAGCVRARFRETRHFSLLTSPLETEGVLYFAPPDRLARYTTRPGTSSIVVRDGRVILRDETGSQALEIGSSEIARHLVDHLSVLLRGDAAALRTRYAVAVREIASGWEIRLEPSAGTFRSIVESIRVEGRRGELTGMELVEVGGDRTITAFSEVQRGIACGPAELDRFFPLAGADAAP